MNTAIGNNSFRPDEMLPLTIQHYIDEIVFSIQEPERVVTFILDIALDLLDAENGSLRLVNRRTHQLELRAMRLRSGKKLKFDSSANLDLYGNSIVAQVFRKKQSLLIDDLSEDRWSQNYHPLDKHTTMLSEIAVPLLSNDKRVVIGVLNVESIERAAFKQEHVVYLEALARRALIAIQRAQLLDSIRAIGQQVLAEDPEALLETTVEKLANLMMVPVCSIWLADHTEHSLQLRKAVGQPILTAVKTGDFISQESFIGQAFATGKPQITPNVQTEPSFVYREFAKANGWVSAMTVPIMAGSGNNNDKMGAIFICATEKREFASHDVSLAMAFSDQVAIALKQAELLADRARQLRVTTSTQKVNQALVTATDLNEILDLIVAEASQLLEGDGGILYLKNESLETNIAVATTPSIKHVQNLQTPLKGSLCGWVVRHNKTAICNANDKRIDWNIASRINLETIIAVPLSHNNEVIGAVVVVNRRGRQAQFSETDCSVLEMFAAQATTAINRMRLYERTEQDSKHLDVINTILRQSVITTDIDLLLKKATQQITQALGYKVDIGLIENDNVVLKATAFQGERLTQPGICDQRVFAFNEGIIGTVAYSGEPLVVPNVMIDPRYFPCFPPTKSEMAVPIQSENRTIGVLNVESDQLGAFKQEEKRIFVAIAASIALALKNAQRVKELTTLHNIAIAISQAQDLQEVLREVVSVFQASASSLFMADPAGSRLKLIKQVGVPTAVQQRINQLHRGQSIGGKVLASGEAITVLDMLTDDRADNTITPEDGMHSLASVPIKIEGRIIGVLTIMTEDVRYFSHNDIQLLEAIGSNIGVAIEKERKEGDYTRLFKSARDAIVIFDPQGNIIDMNPQAVELTGYSSTELRSMNITELVMNKEKAKELGERIRKLAAGTALAPVEFQLQHKDGSQIFIESNPTQVHNNSQEVVAIQTVWRNITERKQNETAISRQNELLQSLLEISRAPFDNQAMATLKMKASQLACQLMQSDIALIDDVLNHDVRLSSTLSPSDDNANSVTISKVAATGQPIVANDIFWSANESSIASRNRRKVEHLLAVPLKSKNNIIGVISVIRKGDNAALIFTPEDCNRLEMFAHSLTLAMEYIRLDEYQRKQHTAAKVLEQMGLMGAFLSHKFGGYLGAVALTTRELRRQLQPVDRTAVELMDRLGDISRTAVHVVRQLQGLGQPLHLSQQEKVYLQPLIEKALQQANVPKNIKVSPYDKLKLPPVSGNGELLNEVFEGVIRNAIEAMPDGGILTIRARQSLDSYETRLYFDDSGSGIEPHLADRLFDPFFSTKKDEHGLGIGLWLSRLYLQSLGGDIKVNRRPGRGASFEIRLLTAQGTDEIATGKLLLPKESNEETAIFNAAFLTQINIKNILVVEDEPVWQKTLRIALGRRGRKAHIVDSYEAGLKAMRRQAYDLFIIDVRLISNEKYNQQGLQLAAHILAKTPNTKIIILSAMDELLTIARSQLRQHPGNILFINKADTESIETVLDNLDLREA